MQNYADPCSTYTKRNLKRSGNFWSWTCIDRIDTKCASPLPPKCTRHRCHCVLWGCETPAYFCYWFICSLNDFLIFQSSNCNLRFSMIVIDLSKVLINLSRGCQWCFNGVHWFSMTFPWFSSSFARSPSISLSFSSRVFTNGSMVFMDVYWLLHGFPDASSSFPLFYRFFNDVHWFDQFFTDVSMVFVNFFKMFMVLIKFCKVYIDFVLVFIDLFICFIFVSMVFT